MPSKRIRVLVASVPRMLSDIVVSAFDSDADIELLLAKEETELSANIDCCQPDVLITADIDTALLYDAPRLQVYLLGTDAQNIRRVELRPFCEDIGAVSLAEFAAAVKSKWQH